MQIRTFTKDNIALLYLSAYIEVVRRQGRISFRNTLFEEPVTVQVEDDMQVGLLRRLDGGVTPQEAVSIFADCLRRSGREGCSEDEVQKNAGLLVKNMMVRGILE